MANVNSILLLLSLVITALPSFAKDTTYHDARNPSFSVLVPDGWTATKTDSGVSFNHGNSSGVLWAVTGNRPASEMVADIASQFQKQAKNFREMDKGECRFGGQKGAYIIFSGISPNGTPEISRLVSMTNGQLVYTLLLQTSPDQYDEEKRTFQRIEESFVAEAVATAVDDREKLDALFAAGVINQQEYEARKKNLSSGSTSASSTASHTSNGGSAPVQSSLDTSSQKLAAIDQAYHAGVLTKEEYENKKRQLENPAALTSMAGGDVGTGGNQFRAPDNSYTTLVPVGWTSQRTFSGGQASDIFSPTNGGEERIAIAVTRAMVNLQQMAMGLANITSSMFPGLRLTGPPQYREFNGAPTAVLQYQGVLANGVAASAWQGILLSGGKYYSVSSIAQMGRAPAVEGDAETMFRNLRPGSHR